MRKYLKLLSNNGVVRLSFNKRKMLENLYEMLIDRCYRMAQAI